MFQAIIIIALLLLRYGSFSSAFWSIKALIIFIIGQFRSKAYCLPSFDPIAPCVRQQIFFYILSVQESVTHILYSKLQCKMGNYSLDIKYIWCIIYIMY